MGSLQRHCGLPVAPGGRRCDELVACRPQGDGWSAAACGMPGKAEVKVDAVSIGDGRQRSLAPARRREPGDWVLQASRLLQIGVTVEVCFVFLVRRLTMAAMASVLAACAPAPGSEPGVTGTPGVLVSATGSPSSPPAPPPTTSAPPPPPREVSINYSGDLLWHNTLWKSAEIDGNGKMDFLPQLAALQDYVSGADVAICHSEVPFAKEGGPYTGYPMFKAPPVIAPVLSQIGWDVCTTASNHSLDAGFDGLVRTIDDHAAVGILTSGTFASEEARNTPVIFTTADGVRVGVVSTTFGTNGIPIPKGKEWSVALMDIDDTLAQAHRARQAGADVVVVHMHAGTEYDSKPNSQQVEFAKAMTSSEDVDLVIGQHAHVAQPITKVNGKWVAYGAGNLIAQSGPSKPYTFEGYLATFTFTEQPDGSFQASAAEFVPTFITKHSSGHPARVYIISDALASGVGDASALKASEARTRETVLSMGGSDEGLTER